MRRFFLTTLLIVLCLRMNVEAEPFSKHLYKKFQAKSCTTCHDFFKPDVGLGANSHHGRGENTCTMCHNPSVTGFKPEVKWHTIQGLYTSDMNAKEVCELTLKFLKEKHPESNDLAKIVEKHLLEDSFVLWGIEGATPNSGKLPFRKTQPDLIKGGMVEWKAQVKAWIDGGMSCE